MSTWSELVANVKCDEERDAVEVWDVILVAACGLVRARQGVCERLLLSPFLLPPTMQTLPRKNDHLCVKDKHPNTLYLGRIALHTLLTTSKETKIRGC